jgi:glycosyltransferase involved in cell wall biosynthesis
MKVIGMVGRLVSVKNFELYINAAKQVIDKGIKAKFLIIGEGPLDADLKRLSMDLGLEKHLIFTGFRDDVFRLIAMLDVFVLCSKSETNPIALMEAMASSKPVIATNVGGVAELVDHEKDGVLCPSDDINCLADAIVHLLSNADTAKAFGDRAREKMLKYYSLKRVSVRLLDVYKEMIRAS